LMPESYSGDTIHQLIQKIYIAGVDTGRWPEFLESLSRTVDGGSAILSFIDIQRGGAAVNAAFPVLSGVRQSTRVDWRFGVRGLRRSAAARGCRSEPQARTTFRRSRSGVVQRAVSTLSNRAADSPRVAAAFATGPGCTIDLEPDAVSDVARRLTVTYESARTYVKRLLAKTGARRQAELVRTLLTTMVD
jgi:hypothetical protein